MNPLILVIEEIERLRCDSEKMESELSAYESRLDFSKDNPRYQRLLNEKNLSLTNLCEMRKELCRRGIDMQGNAIYARKQPDGGVQYYLEKAPDRRSFREQLLGRSSGSGYPNQGYGASGSVTTSLYQQQQNGPEFGTAIGSNRVDAHINGQGLQPFPHTTNYHTVNHQQMSSPRLGSNASVSSGSGYTTTSSWSSSSGSASTGSATYNLYDQARAPVGGMAYSSGASTASGSGSKSSKSSQDLPDLTQYLEVKTTLASIMRDFTDNKICFVGHDGHDIGMAEYQGIAKFTKAGEDPANYMKGEAKKFKTGYNKRTNMFTENTLFIPLYKTRAESNGNAPSSSASEEYYDVAQTKMLLGSSFHDNVFSADH